MIITPILNSVPMGVGTEGIASLLQASSVPLPAEIITNDVDYCRLECCYYEEVFALVGGADYQNDKSSFLFQKFDAGDSILFELWRNGAKIEDLNDDTFGTYYASFTNQTLYTGFIIDWESVFSVHGGGNYIFKAQKTLLGETSEFVSRNFKLIEYDDFLADGTVKIVAFQKGNIISNELDYTDLLPDGFPIYHSGS